MAKNERNLLGQSSLSFEQTMTGNSLRERNDEWNAITSMVGEQLFWIEEARTSGQQRG